MCFFLFFGKSSIQELFVGAKVFAHLSSSSHSSLMQMGFGAVRLSYRKTCHQQNVISSASTSQRWSAQARSLTDNELQSFVFLPSWTSAGAWWLPCQWVSKQQQMQFLSWGGCILNVMATVFKAPLFPMQASEKGASGSQISPGEKKRVVQALILQRCT